MRHRALSKNRKGNSSYDQIRYLTFPKPKLSRATLPRTPPHRPLYRSESLQREIMLLLRCGLRLQYGYMYQYKIIQKSAINKWSKDLNVFYEKYYDKNYSTVFKNTALTGVCLNNKKIIGAIRVISDLKRFALLVDLRVDAEHQNKGVATALIKNLIKELASIKVDHINLVVAKTPKWLKKFYNGIGFIEVVDSVLLEYKNKRDL